MRTREEELEKRVLQALTVINQRYSDKDETLDQVVRALTGCLGAPTESDEYIKFVKEFWRMF